MSPSVWWDDRFILNAVSDYRSRLRARIWLDIGTAEGTNPQPILEDVRLLRDTLLAKGWRDLAYFEDQDATHSETAWAGRFGKVLQFLFPPYRMTLR